MATMQPIRSTEEITKLKNYFLLKKQFRNYALLITGLNIPLRISDILNLRWEDVYDFSNNCFYNHIQKREQKTGKLSIMTINTSVKEALKLYLAHLETKGVKGYIFYSLSPEKPLSRVSAYLILKKASKELGMEFIGCHSMRKTFGYHAWKKGASLAVIMSIYNHSSIQITKRYLGVEQADKDEVFEHNLL